MSVSPIAPVYVIAGFLGSGKTTLLKRALAHQLDQGIKPAVLMNEFGEVDVDGSLLHDHPRSHDIELEALLSGCICCDLSGEFSEKVGRLVGKSKGAPLFIETTGLADTGQVVQGVEKALAVQQKGSARGALASVIVMVDAPRFLKLGAYWAAAEEHLNQADIVVLNKLDQVGTRQADVIERRVKAVNPRVRLVRTVHADVPIERLFKGTHRAQTSVRTGVLKNSAAGYQSGSFKILKPFDPVRLEAWLKRYQRSVIRMKGFVTVHGLEGFQELQWVMGSLALTPYHGSTPSQAMVVVIGRRVPWQRFLEGLETCLVKPVRRTKRQPMRWSRARRRT